MPNLAGMPTDLFGAGGPNILENRSMIKSVLNMFRENPKQMLGSFSAMTNNPQLNALSSISEGKLRFVANALYYIVSFVLEVVYYFKKYKSQIVMFIIALLVYKLIL